MKTHKIALKDLTNVQRWALGALARRRIVKMIATAKIAGKYSTSD